MLKQLYNMGKQPFRPHLFIPLEANAPSPPPFLSAASNGANRALSASEVKQFYNVGR